MESRDLAVQCNKVGLLVSLPLRLPDQMASDGIRTRNSSTLVRPVGIEPTLLVMAWGLQPHWQTSATDACTGL